MATWKELRPAMACVQIDLFDISSLNNNNGEKKEKGNRPR